MYFKNMEQRGCGVRREQWKCIAFVSALIFFWSGSSAHITYTIPEEMYEGAIVANIATDLGLDLSSLRYRRFRIVSSSAKNLFQVNQNNGMLFVAHKIDREKVCERSSVCLLNLEILLENPQKTISVTVEVVDHNDNSPSFPEKEKKFEISEAVLPGARFQLQPAHDPDGGLYSVQHYKLSDNDYFRLEVKDGGEDGKIPVLNLQKPLDRKATIRHTLLLTALDGGEPPRSGTMQIIVDVFALTQNDNAPEIEVKSFSNTIPEDSRTGTIVALVSVNDLDSGENGKIVCFLSEDVPFILMPSLQDNWYSIVTKSPLDREKQSEYDLTIVAKDSGQPSLSSVKTIRVFVSDVNDNSPEFSLSHYTFFVAENIEPGVSVFSVHASDLDINDNALLSYRIIGDLGNQNKLTSFLNMDSENGTFFARKSFDFETLKTLQFQVSARDSGTPSLSSNVTVNVFILDQNDNAPLILYPVSTNGSAEGVEEIPRNVNPGHLVTKVSAYDADIGYNGWLMFSLQEVTDHSLFALDRYTGQIRTLRSFTEKDEAEHKLVILVKDNGNVSLSATATVIVKVVPVKKMCTSVPND
ncbi:hypothetical protein DPEC_G00025370 [Dallia pectoralis]|uniref:Uncharacterized protein n=1 Tax=Dallia pectoralis TaxID=75939 RepID=A0ACC2HI59_DALPE|nr:hypothetical protein DPEC_G00025370 [Dallia pectoralis]